MTTQQEAQYWAETGAEILLSNGDLFKGRVDKDSLVRVLYEKILQKLVNEDTYDLSEDEFKECIIASVKK